DRVKEDHGPRPVVHEVRAQVAQAVQVVRVDVVLAERRREPDDSDLLVAPMAHDMVRVLAGDVDRTPAGVDRPLERRKGSLRLLLLDKVGPTFFEVFLLPEEQIPEKLVLLVGEQERPREPPHGTALPSGGPFLYVSYRLSDVRVDCVRGLRRSTDLIIAGLAGFEFVLKCEVALVSEAGRSLYRGTAFRPLPWRRLLESSEGLPWVTRSNSKTNRRNFS